MIRGPLAVLSSLLLVALPTHATSSEPAGEVTCTTDTPASESARARLHVPSGSAEGTPGYWISDGAMNRAAARINACVDGYTKCQVDLSVAQAKGSTPAWRAWAIGIGVAITVGLATGYVAGRASK